MKLIKEIIIGIMNIKNKGDDIVDKTNNIKSGDVLITSNGNFMIVGIECCGQDTEEFFGWCAMFVDDTYEYPLEIQYIISEDNLDLLIEQIKIDQQIIEVVKSRVILSQME